MHINIYTFAAPQLLYLEAQLQVQTLYIHLNCRTRACTQHTEAYIHLPQATPRKELCGPLSCPNNIFIHLYIYEMTYSACLKCSTTSLHILLHQQRSRQAQRRMCSHLYTALPCLKTQMQKSTNTNANKYICIQIYTNINV